MANKKKEDIVVGLDIGTSKVCAIVGQKDGDGVRILGMGVCPSYGLRKGVVVNIDNTVESIRSAVKDASKSAGVEIHSAENMDDAALLDHASQQREVLGKNFSKLEHQNPLI